MRKAQKKQIMEIMDSLCQAHKEIELCAKNGEIQNAQAGLADCQDCIMEIAKIVEETEGEDCDAVHAMESYCEELFLQYNRLQENANEPKLLQEILTEKAKEIITALEKIQVRKEVVFFPYKASMWDSLESIYLKAKEDENCDAYCVPIPYYDLNADGSLGQMHYEGNEYPKNIEVIDWQTYSFEERKPDAIYIHNPYDDWNRVTSVHPRFYAANLKKYTEELVYVPYFVLQEIEPDNQAVIDSMKHFCFLPGTIWADKVILQSEKMAQIYINEYCKEAVANKLPKEHTDKELLKKKFLGLGSPKYDKVQNAKREDLEIPKEWLKIIEKPDGSFKKIVFYNTSISALLQHDKRMIEKMKDVFRIFYENKEEVALLWRPHPLIENTIKSMRPQLCEEYQKLVAWYKEDGWGIYDDTADMDRAVVLSDAYYGDSSSVVQVYQKTGKPVMLQRCIEKFNLGPFFGLGILVTDVDIWIPSAMTESFAQVEKKTGEVKQYYHYDNAKHRKAYDYYMYTQVINVGNYLLFAPTRANSILVYNICTSEKEYILLDNLNLKYTGNYCFLIKYEKNVYFVGMCGTNLIGKWDMEIRKMTYYGKIFDENSNPVYGRNASIEGTILYIPLLINGDIYSLNLQTGEEKLIHVDNQKRELVTLNNYDNFLYITTEDGQIIKLNIVTKKVQEIKTFNQGRFYSSYCYKNFLWLFPLQAQELALKIDLKDFGISTFKVPAVVYDVQMERDNDKILYLNIGNGIAKLNCKNEITIIPYNAQKYGTNTEILLKWNGKKLLDYTYVGEQECVSLEVYIDEIICDSH